MKWQLCCVREWTLSWNFRELSTGVNKAFGAKKISTHLSKSDSDNDVRETIRIMCSINYQRASGALRNFLLLERDERSLLDIQPVISWELAQLSVWRLISCFRNRHVNSWSVSASERIRTNARLHHEDYIFYAFTGQWNFSCTRDGRSADRSLEDSRADTLHWAPTLRKFLAMKAIQTHNLLTHWEKKHLVFVTIIT